MLESETQSAQGQRDAAEQFIIEAIEQHDDSAALHAQLGKLHFERGHYADAETEVAMALKLEPNQLLARLIQAQLFTEQGELKKADEGFRWFVRYYNQAQPSDAESLVLVALGATQHAPAGTVLHRSSISV